MAGRKPKATAIKILNGNPGKRPYNDLEPKPESDLPNPPEWMNELQKEIWLNGINSCPVGMLTSVDESIFTTWVVACSIHRDATEKVNKYGVMIKSPEKGVPMQSPYLSILNKQAELMLRSASELGFSPTSRTKVTSQKVTSSANKFKNNGVR